MTVSKKLLQRAYAQDASIYQETPEDVLFPKDTREIMEILRRAQAKGQSVIPRAAGTSLAGQCVGSGVVLDTGRYMNEILEVNVQERWVEVQPGVVRDELNAHLLDHGLFFGPNTSTSNRCMIGGMVGNNSSGSTSISYGTTREKLLGMEFITADGALRKMGSIQSTGTEDLPDAVLKWEKEWLETFVSEGLSKHFPDPSIHRRNSGYAIDLLAQHREQSSRWLHVLSGSEGTLALTTKIRLALDPLPPKEVAVLAFHYHTLDAAMAATPELMQYRPFQLELMDRIILDCTKDSKEYASYRSFVEGDPAAVLLVEFRAASPAELKSILSDISSSSAYARPELWGAETDRVWKLRAAGLGLLANVPGDAKPVACIEDTAVKVEVLQDYIAEFDQLMASFGQEAVYYAHAGAGELHLRPILNLKKTEGVEMLFKISKASAELVKKYGGSLSGEHGDGRVRAAFLKDFYGEDVYTWMERLKGAWDPKNILNPGKIVAAKPMTEDLRYVANRKEPDVVSKLDFSADGGFLRAVEKCNGSGDCRRLPHTGAHMCPSYMASRDEWDSTRGRANVLRSVLTEQSTAGFTAPELAEAMEHCVACKGCTKECPSGVDMAAMKLEFLYQNKGNRSLSTWAFAHFHKANEFPAFRPFLNTLFALPPVRKLLGISPNRSMPKLAPGAVMRHYNKTFSLENALAKTQDITQPVILWADEFTVAQEPLLVGKAIDILEAFGYLPVIFDRPSGRALLSGGYLEEAQELAVQNTAQIQELWNALGPVPVVGLEPSAVLSAKDEYLRLLPKLDGYDKDLFMTLDYFLSQCLQKTSTGKSKFKKCVDELILHVHCHQKALESPGETAYVLRTLLGAKVQYIKSSCCGMAGSYGMKKEHQEMSRKMANLVLIPAIASQPNAIVVATGTSCRHQISDLAETPSAHLADILWDHLKHDIH